MGKEQLAPAIIFFALLCWINCVGIEKWEGGNPHATTRWASLHLRSIVTMIALFSLAAALLAPSRGLTMVYLAALISSGCCLHSTRAVRTFRPCTCALPRMPRC